MSEGAGTIWNIGKKISLRPSVPHWRLTGWRWAVLGSVVLALVIAAGTSRYGPEDQELGLQFAQSSWSHPLGTDSFGRDVLVRVVSGARYSLGLTALALVLSALLGTAAGMLAGWRGGPIAQIVLSLIDVVVAIPQVLVALILVTAIGPGLWTLLLAAVLGGWTAFARLAHQLTLKISAANFVEAAVVSGAGQTRLLVREILPNAARPMLALLVLRFPHVLLAIAGLSFLGLGVQPPTPEWGAMLAEGFTYVAVSPLLVLAPGGAIVLASFVAGALGRGLEQRWAPGRAVT